MSLNELETITAILESNNAPTHLIDAIVEFTFPKNILCTIH